MEKEKKGLFGRLLDFWKEKISMGEPNGIEFWNDTETVEKHLSEMGAVASLTQKGTRKAFWEETAESVQEEAENQIFFAEVAEMKKPDEAEEETFDGKKDISKMFTAEVFWNGGRETEEPEKNRLGKAFMWEMPEEEKAVRNIIPVAEEVKQEKEPETEAAQEIRLETMPEQEEKQPEPQIDIEKLMRQMTKKLWEERESCGRRLR